MSLEGASTPTKNSGLKTKDWPQRSCGQCVCATTVWNGRPEELICVNSPGHAGQMTRVAGGDAALCRSFRAKPRPPVRAEPPAPTDERVRCIPLTKGLFAVVDAEDYEWLSEHKWRTFGGDQCYASTTIRGKTVFMHRLIMNPSPGMVVDHINGRKQDNRRCNLRVCTQAQNVCNRPGLDRTSRFKGVHRDGSRKKWVAMIRFHGKRMCIGRFDDEIEAARAYDRRARELFGAFAYLNFPGPARVVLLSGRICVRSRVRGRIGLKEFEIRISKAETISNDQGSEFGTGPRPVSPFWSLEYSSFELVSNFGFRASDFSGLSAWAMATGPPEGEHRRS